MAKVISQKRFIAEALEAHNQYRRQHDAPQLELSQELTSDALEWAEHLALTDSLKYRNTSLNNEQIGENILRAKAIYLPGDECTKEWYKEEAEYKYNGFFNPAAGHFTQLVWKSTRKVGFAYAQTLDGYFYVVANYYPAGNYRNEFEQNVVKSSTIKDLIKPFFPEPKSSPNINRKIEPKSINLTKGSVIEPRMVARSEPSYYEPNLTKGSVIEPRIVPRSEPTYYEPRMLGRAVPASEPELKGRNVSDDMSNFIQEALNAHNLCRKKHGSEPLVHNPELTAIAQQYANYLAKIGSLIHSTNTYNGNKLGENLFFSYDSRTTVLSGEKPTMDWYDEIKMYKYNDYQSGTGHFTQVVWKDTKEVGFGVTKAKDGSFYVVANYYPPGNFIGKFADNVKRPFY